MGAGEFVRVPTTCRFPTIRKHDGESHRYAMHIRRASPKRAAFDVEIDVVLEVERVGDIRAAARHEDASAALHGAVVDRLLDGGRARRFGLRLRDRNCMGLAQALRPAGSRLAFSS